MDTFNRCIFATIVSLLCFNATANDIPEKIEYPEAAKKAVAVNLASQKSQKIDIARKDRNSRTFREENIIMHTGQVIVLDTGPVDRVAVGNGKLASTTVLDNNRLLIIAQDVGETNILLWDKKRPLGNLKIRITATDVARVKGEIAAMLNDIPDLTVGNAGDRIFIDASNLSPEQMARIKAVKEQFPNVIDRTIGIMQPLKPAPPSAMVMFDLYFLEFKKNHLQDLGVSWKKSFNGVNFGAFGETTSGPLNLRPGIGGSGGVTFDPPLPMGKIDGLSTALNVAMSVPGVINLAVNTGQATLLAAPKLAVRSGGVAKFLAGGEFPIAISGITGNTVEYKQYGILLEVEPKINADNTVAGVIRTEVSSLDPAVVVNGFPGMIKRRTETDFSTPMGEAIVLSGLYSQELSNSIDKIPLLGDVPVLKAFFSNKGENRKNTELVVFIIPRAHSSEESINKSILARASDMSAVVNTDIAGWDILPKLTIESNLWQGQERDFNRVTPQLAPRANEYNPDNQ